MEVNMIEEKVRSKIEEEIQKCGYLLDKVSYLKESSVYYLRVEIDKEGFIDLDDCVKVTEAINPIVDKMDFLTDNYILDVCSKEKGCE